MPEREGHGEQGEIEESAVWKRSRGAATYRIQTSVIPREEVLAQKQRGGVESRGMGNLMSPRDALDASNFKRGMPRVAGH